MYYYETDDGKGKIIGGIATAVYMIVLALLMFLVNFKFEARDTGEGILINFGDTESASGTSDPTANTTVSPAQQQAASPVDLQNIVTQDFDDDAPEIPEQAAERQTRPAETARPAQNTSQTDSPPVEQPRQVNQAALFPGRTENSGSASEGTAVSGAGNQGVQEGSPMGSHEGTGMGAGGAGFDLAGRSVMGTLPQPAYGANKQGRVIIKITVDAAGIVKNASYRARGSITNDSELVNAALRAARQSRFNKIEAEGEGLQMGTITYNFQLK